VEAGGKSGQGISWSEQVEPKEIFHKVLPVVWAQVKAGELDDEARMADRAEKGILRNVVRTLSEDYFLSNSHTAIVIRDNASQEPRLAAYFEPWRWYKVSENANENAKSANELLEEQKSQKGIKGGRIQSVSRGGLKMKDSLGKGAATVFGSKLGHQNRLAGSVKDGIFSKPMMGAGSVAAANRGGGTAVISRPPGPGPEAPREPSPPAPEPRPPVPEPRPPVAEPRPPVPEPRPPVAEPRPPVPEPRPPVAEPRVEPVAPTEPQRKIEPVSLRPDPGPTGFGTTGFSQPVAPPVGPGPIPPAPPPAVASPPNPEPQPALPTPRDLAARVTAEARSGAPDERARAILRKDPEARQQLMNQMRQLHVALGSSNDAARLLELTDGVLWQLARLAVESEMLVRAYGMGYQGRSQLMENLEEAKEKLKIWLSRFAKLF
jgi:hypothetical protein